MTFVKQVCVCEISETGRDMGPSLKAHDLTLKERLPKQSDLENYKCCCTKGKCKMSQLIRLCQEDPDIIINMYRISKSEDKCLPEIDLDAAGQTYDSAEKLDGTSGNKKYHYLMTDRSTSNVDLKDPPRQETKESVETQQSSNSYPSKGILRKTVTNLDLNSIRGSPRHSVQSGGSNRTVTSKREENNSISSGDDKAKNVIMVEPPMSMGPVEKPSNCDSSHILSLLNMVVKQRRQSLITQMVPDDSQTKIGRKCLNWLRCVPCVKKKKNENREHFKHEIPSVHSNPSIDTIDMSVQANELQV